MPRALLDVYLDRIWSSHLLFRDTSVANSPTEHKVLSLKFPLANVVTGGARHKESCASAAGLP
jgi:hypothetical protein